MSKKEQHQSTTETKLVEMLTAKYSERNILLRYREALPSIRLPRIATASDIVRNAIGCSLDHGNTKKSPLHGAIANVHKNLICFSQS